MTLLTNAKVCRRTNFLTPHPGRSCTSAELQNYGIMTLAAEAWTRFLVSDSSDGWEAMNAMSPEIARKLQQQEKEFWSDEAQRYAYIVADDQERVRLTDREIALEESREEKKMETVFRMLAAKFTDEQILVANNITQEQLDKYKSEYKKYNYKV